MVVHRLGAVILLSWSFAVLAQGTAASAPVNQTAVDLSSPKAALESVYTALKAGDIPAAKLCLSFKDANQAELFDITYTQLYGPMQLMHAMEARFGAAGRKPFANAALEKSLDELLGRVKGAEFQVEGDAAHVVDKKAAVNPSAENELTGINFIRENGQWKIVAGSFSDAGGGSADLPPAQLGFMRVLRDSVVAACQATEIRFARGDFKNADEAFADYQTRMQAGTRAAALAATTQRNDKPLPQAQKGRRPRLSGSALRTHACAGDEAFNHSPETATFPLLARLKGNTL